VHDRGAELHLRLAHAHAHALSREAFQEGRRNRARHRFQQLELRAVGDRPHGLDDLAVVDGLLDPVGGGLRQLELEVVEEGLLGLALLVVHAVPPGDLEPRQLDDDRQASAACAAARASTCSRTSWARTIVAPRS
jgi:hypothetical protein